MADHANNDAIVEAEDENDPVDSAIGSDIASFTTSLITGAEGYKWEHGRRYHGFREGSYQFPNDEQEQERYNLMHQLFILAMENKHFLAPVSEDMSRILDIGTGTGIWAIEIGDMYPTAQIIGNDLSPIQPRWVPPNVVFEVDDVEDEWQYSQPFDFIHSRYMAGSIADWPQLMRRCYQNVKPGGWVEFQDFDLHNYSQDDSIPRDNKVLELYNLLIEGCEKIGRTASPGQNLKSWAEGAGFVNVHDVVFKLPLGRWPKDERLKQIGTINLVQFLEGLDAFTLSLFTKALGWSVEAIQILLVEVRRDAMKKGVHMMHDFHVVYAQKPTTEST